MTTGVYKWSKTAATNASADTSINWAEGQAPSSVNDSARAMMARLAEWRDDKGGALTTAGTSTAFTLATNEVFDSLADLSGQMICFVPHATSGAAPTLAVDGLTAHAINISTGVAVPTGALLIGTPYFATYYNATTEFILVGWMPVKGATTFTGTITGAAATLSGLLTCNGGWTGTTGTLSGLLTLSSTAHMLAPNGTTAQRSGTTESSFRYNSDLKLLEFYDGGAWRNPSIAQPIAAGFKNLKITNNAVTPNTKIDVTADAVTVETSGGTAYRLKTVSLTINAGTTGANALDANDTAIAVSTWYAIYVIYNPSTDTVAGMVSTNATAPVTLPSGYTAYCRVGWNRTDGSSHFNRVLQYGKRAQYVVVSSSATPNMPSLSGGSVGAQGDPGVPTWVAASVSNFVPSTASRIVGSIAVIGTAQAIVAPNNSYGARTSTTNSPPVFTNGTTGVSNNTLQFEFMLESTNIYWAANSGSGNNLYCLGWEDNI